MSRRSAWGLDTRQDTPIHWSQRAACANPPMDLWSNPDTFGEAAHVCLSHCPVLTECFEWAQTYRWSEMVIAGQVWAYSHGTPRPAAHQPKPTSRMCTQCRENPEPPRPRPQWRTPPSGPAKDTKPCGTYAAYQRHRSRREPIDEACRQARLAYDMALRERRQQSAAQSAPVDGAP